MQANRTALTEVHVVEVFDRTDGTYYFALLDDALEFAAAVRENGGRCFVDTVPVVDDHATTRALVAEEAEEDL